jgi:glycerol uptake facilitator-like aquaporin
MCALARLVTSGDSSPKTAISASIHRCALIREIRRKLSSDYAMMLQAGWRQTSVATGSILYVPVAALAPASGVRFNPAVTLVMALPCEIGFGTAALHAPTQIAGCVAGALLSGGLNDPHSEI